MKVEIRPVVTSTGIFYVIRKPGFLGSKYWCGGQHWKSENDIGFFPDMFVSIKKTTKYIRKQFGDQCHILSTWL